VSATGLFRDDSYPGIVIIAFVRVHEGADQHTASATRALVGIHFELHHRYTFPFVGPDRRSGRRVRSPACRSLAQAGGAPFTPFSEPRGSTALILYRFAAVGPRNSLRVTVRVRKPVQVRC